MKIKLLIPILAFLLASCSKKNSENLPNTSLGNDSLMTRLSLKISDKSNLTIDKQLYKDTKGNYLISGLKDKKFWIGYFDVNGNELVTKAYDDPSEMTIGYGAKITVSHSFIFGVYEAADRIFITRQIRKNIDLGSDDGGFVESQTVISQEARTIDNKYSEVAYGGDVLFTLFIGSWYNGGFVISRETIKAFAGAGEVTNFVYDNSGTLKNSVKGRLRTGYLAISDTDLIFIDNNLVVRKTILNLEKDIYSTILFPTLATEDKLTINSKIVENNILTVTGSVTTFSGSTLSVIAKVDLNTGKLVS